MPFHIHPFFAINLYRLGWTVQNSSIFAIHATYAVEQGHISDEFLAEKSFFSEIKIKFTTTRQAIAEKLIAKFNLKNTFLFFTNDQHSISCVRLSRAEQERWEFTLISQGNTEIYFFITTIDSLVAFDEEIKKQLSSLFPVLNDTCVIALR